MTPQTGMLMALGMFSASASGSAFVAPLSVRPLVAPGQPVARAPRLSQEVRLGLPEWKTGAEEPAASQSFTGLLVASLAAGLMALAGDRRRTTLARRVAWDYIPAFGDMVTNEDPTGGPVTRNWENLRRKAKFFIGRQKYFKQQEILRENGIQGANGGYRRWYPNRDQFQPYKGEISHPDNPYFPAASPGYGRWKPERSRALPSSSPSMVGATVLAPTSLPNTFAGGSSKRLWRSHKVGGSALILHAHKKTSASTKNQGHSLRPHFWGLTKHAYQGNAVKAGTLLAKQKGMNWYAGKNVARGRDYSLTALRDGIVQWRGEYRHREVSVIPWEYVRAKCTWSNPNTLGPKEYEPWMGSKNKNKRWYILELRKEWLESEKGQEWLQKKEAKKAKQKEINMKVWDRVKRIKKRKAAERGNPREPVVAGSDSESEA